ncbi:hypothetical protein NDU88_002923 [Pleurodeles waltl]|uniref:Uncharacterized protein n=1 Tax=Pleurodeles waltl TaxID=8319 RepID=A0AAV7L0E5_PLEWA|nr:hypothetical protein NDU88_002923 [Pleurodeles waltl]
MVRLIPFHVYISPAGQQPSKEGYMSCHRKGGAEPGGVRQAEHPLSETVGGPETLGTEDGGGPAGYGLPTRKGCPSYPNPSPMARILVVAYPELDWRLGHHSRNKGVSTVTFITTYASWGGIRVGDVGLWEALGQPDIAE